MEKFTATIKRFDAQGEKTGWTYIEVPVDITEQLYPSNRKPFRVKGKLDKFPIEAVALLPMGGGSFILVLNAAIRKGIGKKKGGMLSVQLSRDMTDFRFNKDFMDCLADDPSAKSFFESLTPGHQRYFSKWIDEAKTTATQVKRMAMAVNALAKKWGYTEMIRAASVKR